MGPQVEAGSTHVDTGGVREVPGLGCQGDIMEFLYQALQIY